MWWPRHILVRAVEAFGLVKGPHSASGAQPCYTASGIQRGYSRWSLRPGDAHRPNCRTSGLWLTMCRWPAAVTCCDKTPKHPQTPSLLGTAKQWNAMLCLIHLTTLDHVSPIYVPKARCLPVNLPSKHIKKRIRRHCIVETCRDYYWSREVNRDPDYGSIESQQESDGMSWLYAPHKRLRAQPPAAFRHGEVKTRHHGKANMSFQYSHPSCFLNQAAYKRPVKQRRSKPGQGDENRVMLIAQLPVLSPF